jgi:hypothetical protein
MSLLTVLRSGVRIADKVTRPLQCTVGFERCTGLDDQGARAYAEGIISLRAIVDSKVQQVRNAQGILDASRATITLLDVVALDAATGNRGVMTEDRFTLQDGTTGPVLNVGGFADAGTGRQVTTQVYIG